MRTPAEAIDEILARAGSRGETEHVGLDAACSRVLARDVRSDVDLPPFEKSAMDGFAVASRDFDSAEGPLRLRVIGESRAGAPFDGAVGRGACVAIYTGAELPGDCDAVVMVEKSRPDASSDHVVLDDRPRAGQHVCHRGEDLQEGELVLRGGRRLSPIDLAVLAAVGCQPVPVFRRPRVGLLTTGDELVPADRRPRRGEIREGNTWYLASAAAAAGAEVQNHGIVPDDEVVLERVVREALASSDLLITTGGVSMGKYDFVGAVLERAGVEPVFHKIAIKPGKPLWFGARGRVPVLGLPGNPVSCLIGFEVFVRPALQKLAGVDRERWITPLRLGCWQGGTTRENPRQQNLPVQVTHGDDGVDRLEPLPWTSSADIVELSRADGLAVIEAGAVLARGELVRFRPLDGGRAG